MSVMFILLPVALLFSGAAVLAFVLATRAGQFDDLKTPALRVLHEDIEIDAPAADTRGTSAAEKPESALGKS